MKLREPFATRLCFSGLESRRLLDTFADFGIKHIQVSYYYLRRVFPDPEAFAKYIEPFYTVIVDSGTVYHRLKSKEEEAQFLRDYGGYIGGLNKQAFTAAVYEGGSMLDSILPDEMLIYPLDDIRPVFDNNLDDIFKQIRYIGVGNKEASARGDNMTPIFAAAQRNKGLVHAFGTSSKRILSKHPFYSANSSSWRSGSRYLNTYIYEGPSRGLRLYQPTDKKDPIKTEKETRVIRKRQENLCRVRTPRIYEQINWEGVYEGDSWEVDNANLAQWVLYQTDLENQAHRKYFLSPQDIEIINTRKMALLGNSPTPRIEGNIPKESRHGYQPKKKEGTRTETSKGRENKTPNKEEVRNSPSNRAAGEEEPDNKLLQESGTLIPYIGPPDIEGVPATDKPTVYAENKRLRAYDDRMRTLRKCDDCILAGRCPKYEPGASCAYGLGPQQTPYDHNNLEAHILEDAADILQMQKDRVLQGYQEEKVDAAGLSKDLNREVKTYMELVALLSEATDKRDEISVRAKGTGALDMFKQTRGH